MSRLSLLAAVALVPLGCGGGADDAPTTYHVKGTVTFDGKPVPKGAIKFVPTGGGPAGSTTIDDGKYDTSLQGKGIVGGKHIVEVSGFDGNAKPDEELPFGDMLFPAYEIEHAFPGESEEPVEQNFEVPKEAAKGK